MNTIGSIQNVAFKQLNKIEVKVAKYHYNGFYGKVGIINKFIPDDYMKRNR
jgi:hypothetical protein